MANQNQQLEDQENEYIQNKSIIKQKLNGIVEEIKEIQTQLDYFLTTFSQKFIQIQNNKDILDEQENFDLKNQNKYLEIEGKDNYNKDQDYKQQMRLEQEKNICKIIDNESSSSSNYSSDENENESQEFKQKSDNLKSQNKKFRKQKQLEKLRNLQKNRRNSQSQIGDDILFKELNKAVENRLDKYEKVTISLAQERKAKKKMLKQQEKQFQQDRQQMTQGLFAQLKLGQVGNQGLFQQIKGNDIKSQDFQVYE